MLGAIRAKTQSRKRNDSKTKAITQKIKKSKCNQATNGTDNNQIDSILEQKAQCTRTPKKPKASADTDKKMDKPLIKSSRQQLTQSQRQNHA